VVTSGQFLIDSESKLQEVVKNLLAGGAQGAPGHEGHEMPAPAPMEADAHTGREGHAMPAHDHAVEE
jgi:hypothetical protein